jgi:hypothetical protein
VSALHKVTTDNYPYPHTLKRQWTVKGRDFCAERKFGFFITQWSEVKVVHCASYTQFGKTRSISMASTPFVFEVFVVK